MYWGGGGTGGTPCPHFRGEGILPLHPKHITVPPLFKIAIPLFKVIDIPYKEPKGPSSNCRKLLFEFKDSDPRRLAEIITGDETWMLYDEPLSKERNKVWVVKGEGPLDPCRTSEIRRYFTQFYLMHMTQILVPKVKIIIL